MDVHSTAFLMPCNPLFISFLLNDLFLIKIVLFLLYLLILKALRTSKMLLLLFLLFSSFAFYIESTGITYAR